MLDYREAVAAIAAALDDAERSLIGDPREGVYKVSLISTDMREAMQYAKQFARLGVIATTTISHDDLGRPVLAHVNVYDKGAQNRLLEIVQSKLTQPRRQRLEDLVLARGPIPNDILKRIATAHDRGMRPQTIAGKLNQLGIVAGMGGKGWTAKKVKAALAEHERQLQPHQQAAL
jgi:hypothetical protein